MATSGTPATVLWVDAMRPIWIRALVAIARRLVEQGVDGVDPELVPAADALTALLQERSWTIRAIAPLRGDPSGHEWAVVLTTGQRLVVVHGVTLSAAMRRVVAAASGL